MSYPRGTLTRLHLNRLKMAVRIATGAVAHIGGSGGFAIGCRSRHNFPRNIGRRFLPYKAMNLFPGRVLGRCRVQPEPVVRSLTHRLCMRCEVTAFTVAFLKFSESSGGPLPRPPLHFPLYQPTASSVTLLLASKDIPTLLGRNGISFDRPSIHRATGTHQRSAHLTIHPFSHISIRSSNRPVYHPFNNPPNYVTIKSLIHRFSHPSILLFTLLIIR
ncbi:hypothetical protein EVAR_25055_1 [Eumeta japonica]|uniref:Uncharacterized protein n=1 Tax=Eumeta variegata TaxID=151549 RepID=A0A4C1V819_EUMVA|nr:hypothetical protein EVAR_25055_1 [Eumeta japonica]